jgi:ParB-like chromosome segregation protein Spo0J
LNFATSIRLRRIRKNPRRNEAAVQAVANSIQAYGWRVPIVVDEQGVVVAGDTRLEAAKKLGITHGPVHVATGLTAEQTKAYRIADNQTASPATWDDDRLTQELADLQAADFEMDLLGFPAEQLADLLGTEPTTGLTDPDEVPEPPAEPITQAGDLWLLGEHRLLCGDSTDPTHVARLMDGQTARMLFTDPPWNVAIGKHSNPRHRQRRGLLNDDLSPDAF